MTTAALLIVLVAGATARESRYDSEIAEAIADARRVYPVPAALVKAVIATESSFNPLAISPAGAIGLMQIMPRTAPRVGVRVHDLRRPRDNILAGVRLLAVLLRHYQGDIVSALVAYNARPRRLFAPIPQNGETPAYVVTVLRRCQAYTSDERPRF